MSIDKRTNDGRAVDTTDEITPPARAESNL